MHRLLIITEKVEKNSSACSPDLTGCVATERTRRDAGKNMHTAIQMHIRGLMEDCQPVTESNSSATFVSVP